MSHEKKDSVGARILKVQGEMGVTEFADELGVNRKTITRWVANDSLPDGASLLALMQKFGADPAWVLTGSGAAPDLAPRERILLEKYRAVPPDVQDATQTLLDAAAKSGVKKGKAA